MFVRNEEAISVFNNCSLHNNFIFETGIKWTKNMILEMGEVSILNTKIYDKILLTVFFLYSCLRKLRIKGMRLLCVGVGSYTLPPSV